MRFKKKLALSILVTFTLVQASVGIQPTPIKPVPREAFSPIKLYEPQVPSSSPTPKARATPSPTPKPTPAPTFRPTKKPVVTPKPVVVTVTPKPVKITGNSASGVASFYCNRDASRGPISRCTKGYSGGYFAAIRRDLLFLRGRTIQACSGGSCINVKIIDCNCGAHANLIDLYGDAFVQFYPLSKGKFQVKIKW